MKAVFKQYASYHLWANKIFVDFILTLPEEQQYRETPSSFPSIFKTLVHMFNVDRLWWQRIEMKEGIQPPTAGFDGSVAELAQALLQQDETWESWVHEIDDVAFERVLFYQNSRGDQFQQPVYQLLMQLFNHGTYHRGQLVTMFHQLGIKNIPATDFIVWSRK